MYGGRWCTLYVTRVVVHQRRQFSTQVETAVDLFLLLKNAILRRVPNIIPIASALISAERLVESIRERNNSHTK